VPTTSFTTRIDSDLKERLEQIAQRDNRSASYIANLAIRNLVEEREATRELLLLGLELAKSGTSIPAEEINAWLRDPGDRPFPEPSTGS
jgi:predicted transcriptional regulator